MSTHKSSKDYYNELESGIIFLKDLIDKYKNNQNIEIEIRIGRIDHITFKPGINNINFFNKILNNFKSANCWDKIEIENTKEIFNSNIKKIISLDNLSYKFINKIQKEKHDFIYENSPFDIRINVAEEEEILEKKIIKNKTINFNENDNFTRIKHRNKFYYKNEFVIDITYVKEINNTVIIEKYEIEVELLNLNSSMSSMYKAHSALLLIRDMINFCEELNESAELLQLEISDLRIS